MLYEVITFSALKKMIAVRKEISVFADFNNRELIEVENENLFVFGRYNLNKPSDQVLVVANFNGNRITSYNVCYTKLLRLVFTGSSSSSGRLAT